jgi:hypothetical protein
VASGPSPEHLRSKEALRAGQPDAASLLLESAVGRARRSGLGDSLALAADSIGFAAKDLPKRG